jgi:hypothetical protein
MDRTDIYAYLAYALYLCWMVQGARLLAMVINRNWDEAPQLRTLIPVFLRRGKRPKL